MSRVELIGQPYQGKSVIASGQEAVNLYAEFNSSNKGGDQSAPVQLTYYCMPGYAIYADPSLPLPTRCTYRTSIGTAYVVVGSSIYFLTSSRSLVFIGFVADMPSQIIMADNGLVVVMTDGENGYVIDMATNDFAQIVDPNFYPASYCFFLDTFFGFNRVGTNQFFITSSMANFGMLTNSGIDDGDIEGGIGYTDGVYSDVAMTGGTGTGATATISVGGSGVKAGAITTPGTLYTDGTYLNVALTGGGGTGARANITVSGAAVTVVTLVDGGTGYAAAQALSANAADIGGTGSGFVYTTSAVGGAVVSVAFSDAGVGYLVGDVLTANVADIGGTGTGFTYTIEELQSAFDPLDIAAKSGSADPIVAIAAVHKELWLIGELTTEVWIGTGAADFYFQLQQGAYIDHGCAAQYSMAYQDVVLFWLMQDKQGKCLVVKGANYSVEEISTPRLTSLFSNYSTISDAIGFCFQIEAHSFYCLVFPTENKTWLYDLTTGYWAEWAWMDEDGILNRHRANTAMFAYGENLVGDWENGQLLALDADLYTDNGSPITRIKTFPHMIDDGKRVTYNSFIADMEVGTSVQETEDEEGPVVNLSWSDNRGVSYGNAIAQPLGREGQFEVQPQWSRLGMARDRVFKLQWSANCKTALNGAFIQIAQHGS